MYRIWKKSLEAGLQGRRFKSFGSCLLLLYFFSAKTSSPSIDRYYVSSDFHLNVSCRMYKQEPNCVWIEIFTAIGPLKARSISNAVTLLNKRLLITMSCNNVQLSINRWCHIRLMPTSDESSTHLTSTRPRPSISVHRRVDQPVKFVDRLTL